MVRSALAAFAAVAMLASAASAETPALNAAFAQMQQGFKSASAIMKNAAFAPKTAPQAAAVRTRELNVDFRNGRWQLMPNPNPPGSGFQIDVNVGDKVKLSFFNWGNMRGGDESAQFNVRGIDAVVNGKPSNGIYVWLWSRGDSAVVEFDAVKAGIYPIDGSSGHVIIRAKK